MKTNVINELISQVDGAVANASSVGAAVSPCDLSWVEMDDVIDRTYGETEWTPLWRYETIEHGDRHVVGYTEDHLRSICGLNDTDSYVEQGAQLIECAVTGLEKLIRVLSSPPKELA